MAVKLNGKTVRAKAKVTRNPLFLDEQHIGTEPDWDADRALKFSDDEFDHHLRRSFRYYNYFFTQKDCIKHVIDWMKNQPKVFTASDIRVFSKSGDRAINMTTCSLVMAHRRGMPWRGRALDYVVGAIRAAITNSTVVDAPEDKPEVKSVVPTIQDRLNEKTSETIGELEGIFDEVCTSKKPAEFKGYDFLTSNNVPQSQLTKYEAVFNARLAEFTVASTTKDADIKEGYLNFKSADFKRIIAWVTQFLSDIEQYRGVKKATKKARIKKAPSKEKLVAKVKYAKEHKELKLVSVNPVSIVGASTLWVYNVRTRKLGCYQADAHSGTLGIKGTSIIGYDETKSVSKTLRKPAEQLLAFSKAGKIELRKFLTGIKATETRLNGRLSEDVVLLKVV